MKTLHEIKFEKSKRLDDLMTKCLVFFAFSNEQFTENKTPLQDGEKYVSIGAGGYMPKGRVDIFTSGMKSIDKWFKAAIKDSKTRKEHIIYELCNHEAFYTGDIEDTLSTLGEDYTIEEVWSVYKSERAKQVIEF